jgi:hypothetical protein
MDSAAGEIVPRHRSAKALPVTPPWAWPHHLTILRWTLGGGSISALDHQYACHHRHVNEYIYIYIINIQ